jgi:uncharacterized RDD family membrane protein YckC
MNCSACGATLERFGASCRKCGAPAAFQGAHPRFPGTLPDPDEFELESEPIELGAAPVGPPERFVIEPLEAPASRLERRAHFVSRAIAFLIDLAVIAAVEVLLTVLAFAARAFAEAVSGQDLGESDQIMLELVSAAGIVVPALYFTLLNARGSQTLGKIAVNLRVERVDGGALPLVRSVLRAIGYLVSAIPLGLGFLLAIGRSRRALHDYLAGSAVVRV